MKVLLPPIYERIEDRSVPFDSEPFGRKLFADNLTSLFKNTSDGLVISINANWGDGKTSFVKLWEMELQQDENLIPVYYDAFKNDFTSDPFLSIAVLIHKHLEVALSKKGDTDKVKNRKQLDRLKKQTKKLAVEFVKMGTGMAVSHLTAGIVGNGEISDWTGDVFKRLLFGTLEDKVDAQFQAHFDSIDSVKSYQHQLKEMLASHDAGGQQKLVFFVDELDRCRPDFALQVIESIKHLFDIENVFFVLTVNQDLLQKTIEAAYGIKSEHAATYFQKFIHLETELPSIIARGVEHIGVKLPDVEMHIENLCKLHGISEYFADNHVDYRSIVNIIQHTDIGLNARSIERAFSLITIGLGSTVPETQIDKDYLKAVMSG